MITFICGPYSRLIGKDGWERLKEATEDELVGWHYRFNEHEFEQTSGDSEGQGSLACCNPWVHKESDTAGQLNSSIYLSIKSEIKEKLQPISQKYKHS